MIVINDKYAIDSDRYQWKLMRKVKPSEKSPSGWQSFQYYTSLENAAIGLGDLLLRTSHYDSVSELKSNAHKIQQLLNAKINGFKVVYDE